MKILGVSENILDKYGAVSKETALSMSENVKKLFNSSIGLSVTGIAGPGGSSEEKPVDWSTSGYTDNDTFAKNLIL